MLRTILSLVGVLISLSLSSWGGPKDDPAKPKRSEVTAKCDLASLNRAKQARVLAAILKRSQLNRDSLFYRSTPPEFLRQEEDGSLTIGANPHSGTNVIDEYRGGNNFIRVVTLGEKGLAFSTAPGDYRVMEEQIVVSIRLGDALSRGAKLYQSDQGNFFLTLPQRVPAKVVEGNAKKVFFGTLLEQSKRDWDGDVVRVYEFSNDADPSFKIEATCVKNGLQVYTIRFKASDSELQILRFDPPTLKKSDPQVESMVLSYLIQHPNTKTIRWGEEPAVEVSHWSELVQTRKRAQ